MNSHNVDFKNISGGDDEVRHRTNFAARGGPVGVEVVGLNRRDSRDEVGAGVSDEAGSAVLNPGGPVHHLVGREAHLLIGGESQWRKELEVRKLPRIAEARTMEERERVRVLE